MHFDIRPARASDLDALAAIESTAFTSDRISRRSFRRLLASCSAAVAVAEDAGHAVGYALVLYRTGSKRARLYSIAASDAGRGVGQALLEAAELAAKGRGCTVIALEVRADNTPAQRLYERSGYRRTGQLPGYYADGASALRFEKELTLARAEAA